MTTEGRKEGIKKTSLLYVEYAAYWSAGAHSVLLTTYIP